MFKNIKNLLSSMFTVFKHLFKKPVTLEYPEKKKKKNKLYRGKLILNNNCIKCGTCIKVCPSGAISINSNKFNIDLKKCIFCGNCTFYCPKTAINVSSDYELATPTKKMLILEYNIGGDNERNT